MTGLDLETPVDDFDLALEACAIAALEGTDPLTAFGPEPTNVISARLHALSKDSPALTWWNSQPVHPAIYRALKIDPKDTAASYAVAPFRLAQIEGRYVILAALPCPRIFQPADPDHLGIETVLAWDPRSNAVSVLGDANPHHLVGRVPEDECTIYGQPFAFFRAYAETRACFAIQRRAIGGDWQVKPTEPDLTPGLLLIGEPAKVQWPLTRLPDDLTVIGADARAINTAMLRQARIPRARASHLRSAA